MNEKDIFSNNTDDNTTVNGNQEPQNNTQPAPSNASYTYYAKQSQPTNTYYYQPKQTPTPIPSQNKTKKGFSPLTMVICIVLSVVISSGVSVGVVLANTSWNQNASATAGNKNYTVSASYDNYVEAVADACNPSVVGVSTSYKTQSFSIFGGYSTDDTISSGSGVIYTDDGYIITNYHVIQNAVKYNGTVSVYLYNNQKEAVDATIIGYNSSYDLAVLKINKKGLQAIKIGSAESLKIGEPCIAIGSPGGLQFMGSVNAGYISGLNRELTIDTYSMGLIQTDAAINPGNSGGALVNTEGELIGIPSVKIASTDYEGMGFAIAVDDVVSICEDIIRNGGSTIKSTTPYLGVVIDTRYTASVLGQLGSPAGAYVSSVSANSPAEQAGLKTGDVITKINNTAISGYDDLSAAIKQSKVGDTITVYVYRNGQIGSLKVTLASSTDAENQSTGSSSNS